MKNYKYISFQKVIATALLPVSLTLFSCYNEELEVANNNTNENKQEISVAYNTNVSLEDIQLVVAKDNQATRSVSEQNKDILCLTDEKNDTLLYVYNNPEGGWTMYSSDKRVPAIAAQSEKGTFQKAIENDAIALWIDNMASDMKAIKATSNDNLNFSKEEIECNEAYWSSLALSTKKSAPRRELPVLRDSFDLSQGHYEYYRTEVEDEVVREYDHFTTTRWHQYAPFNSGCYANSTHTGNKSAGSVAVAGAQMLFFLHYKLGVPAYAPASWGTHNSNGDTWMSQSNYTTSIWDTMAVDPSYVGGLIANVGCLVDTEYHDTDSEADAENLKRYAFPRYGISSRFGDYNADNMRSSLVSGMPVIVSAYATMHHVLFFVPQYYDNHTFIIDSYRTSRTKTSIIYRWVYDNTSSNTVPANVPNQVEVSYGEIKFSKIRMNWGLNDANNSSNDIWFSPTDNWIINNNGTQRNYQYKREMIDNFSISSTPQQID